MEINLEAHTEKKMEEWHKGKWVGLTTSVIAVLLAISSIMGKNMDNEAVKNRSLSNDQWAYYQAKSIKQTMAESTKELLEIGIAPAGSEGLATQKKTELAARIAKYEKEKEEIKTKAEEFAVESERTERKANKFDLAEAFYQIAIILSAVCVITQTERMWYASIVFGLVAVGTSCFAWLFA